MKKLFTTIILSTLLLSITYSQSIKILGKYVDNNGDTIDCRFRLPKYKKKYSGDNKVEFSKIQYKIRARQIQSDKRVRLKPRDTKSFEFGYNYQYFVFQSVDNQLNIRGRKIFLHKIVDGNIKLYKYYKKIVLPSSSYNSQTGITTNSSLTIRYNRYCLQKYDKQIYKLNRKFIRTDFIDLISDCPKFTEKDGANAYGYNNIYSVLLEYNDCNVKD